MDNTETIVAVIPTPGPEQEQTLTQEVTSIERQAESFIVETDDDYKLACEFGRSLKKKSAEVKSFFKPMKENANKAHRAICDRESAMLKPLMNAEAIIKRSCGSFLQEKERKRRAAEEAARRAAEAERERKLAEAAAAEAAGNNAKAEEAFNEAVIMDEARNVSIVQPTKVKVEGASSVKDWKITKIDQKLVPVELSGAVLRPVDEKAIIKLIRATKGGIKIPGVEFEETVEMRFRR